MSDDWDYRLDGIAWNGAGFVAVGRGGAILVSGDGLHWEQASDSRALLPELVGVAWGGERFVAVAGWPDSMVLHSADGQRWQHARVGSDSDANRYGSNRYDLRGLNDVVWAGDRFVAVGATIASSADGDRWQELLLPLEGTLNAIAWNGQDLIAVGHGGNDRAQQRRRPLDDGRRQRHFGAFERRGLGWRALCSGRLSRSDRAQRRRRFTGGRRAGLRCRFGPRNRPTLMADDIPTMASAALPGMVSASSPWDGAGATTA